MLSTGISSTGEANYARVAGTSMAAPQVAAAAALVRAQHAGWTPAQVREHLQRTAEPIGPDTAFGAGLLDLAAAVE